MAKAWYLENMEGDMRKKRQIVTKIKKDLMAGKKLVKEDHQLIKWVKNYKLRVYSSKDLKNWLKAFSSF